MNKYFSFLATCILVISLQVSAQTSSDTVIIQTSFEQTDTAPYSTGAINGKYSWGITSGNAEVLADTSALFGSQGLSISSNNSILAVSHNPYSGKVKGVTGSVYFDFRIKISSLSLKEFTVNGFDQFGGSSKRSFMIDFTIPTNDTGSVRIWTGSTKYRVGGYKLNKWMRISGKVFYDLSTYQVVLNQGAVNSANFRDAYTPTASGTRPANIKEYHQLLFNFGADTYLGTCNVSIDSLYVGKNPINDIKFNEPVVYYTLAVTQPSAGTITLTPSQTSYIAGTLVSAKLTLPIGYKNYGWSGAASGTDSIVSFNLNSNATLTANVSIDSISPPKLCTVTVVQPSVGTITVSPYFPTGYVGMKDTATLTLPGGYINMGWTGSLAGNELVKTFILSGDVNISALVSLDTAVIPDGKRKTCSSTAEFKSALTNAAPGDTIELTDGVYNNGGITLLKSGTALRPILIRAQNRGKVELTGGSYFICHQIAYVTIEGFVFTSTDVTAIKTESCNHVRITRNTFRLNETTSSKWILIGGTYNLTEPMTDHNRIDHNLFEEKHQLGNYICIDGSPQPNSKISQYDMIDHNYFKNIGPRATNEMEAVRMGVSYMTQTSAFLTFEYNLMENCDGDPEFVSVKSCDNIIRNNTFISSQGTVCLRAGNRTSVYNNFFLGRGKDSTGGVRAYGDDHLIYNNYFEGLKGFRWDAALTITNGDVDSGSTSYSSHFRPRRISFVNNTLVNNFSNFDFGYTNSGNYGKPPSDITIANNIVVPQNNQVIIYNTAPLKSYWKNNIIYLGQSATLGIALPYSQARNIDPKLVQVDSIWRLSANSPAIDSSEFYSFVINDVDGQTRIGTNDIGADEYSSSTIINRPLTPSDVGPNSSDMVSSINENNNLSEKKNCHLIRNYPNPFNPSTKINYVVGINEHVKITVFNSLGQSVRTLKDDYQTRGVYQINFNAANLPSGIYIVQLMTSSGIDSQKILLIK